MHLGITQTENVERDAGLLAFPELDVERMNFANGLGIADGNFVRCDPNSEIVLLVQELAIVPSCVSNVIPLQS